jgi:hypothetical protein
MQGLSKDQIPVNSFKLAGDSIEVQYTTGTLTGSHLSYRDSEIDRTFTGPEIMVDDNTALGQLVTVIIRQVPDFEVVRFILVLPPITVTEHNSQIEVEVTGAIVTERTTIAGPQPGQQTFYSFVTLTGTAQAQVF